MAKLFANSGEPDQMPHSVASDLGLHCLPATFFGISRLKCITGNFFFFAEDKIVKIIEDLLAVEHKGR